jgi:hypothetical protein
MIPFTPKLHNNMGKSLYLFENMNKSEQQLCILGMQPMGFAGKTMIFSCCYPCGKAGAIQIRRCQGIAVDDYGGTLGALALNRSGFCNVGVYVPDRVTVLKGTQISRGWTRGPE